MPFSHFILRCPLLLLPSIFPNIKDFTTELAVCIKWPNYWSFSSSISPSNEYSGLISLKIDWFQLLHRSQPCRSNDGCITQWSYEPGHAKIDWFHLLAVQGIFRSPFQHHSSKASILWHFAFFTVVLSQLYMTPGKTIALTIQTFVSRVMSVLFNICSDIYVGYLQCCPHWKTLIINWSPCSWPPTFFLWGVLRKEEVFQLQKLDFCTCCGIEGS